MDEATAAEIFDYATRLVEKRFRLQKCEQDDLVQEAVLIALPKLLSGTVRFPKRIAHEAVLYAAGKYARNKSRQKSVPPMPVLSLNETEIAGHFDQPDAICIARDEMSKLSRREIHIIKLRMSGYGDDEIATLLGLNRKTINRVRAQIADKFAPVT